MKCERTFVFKYHKMFTLQYYAHDCKTQNQFLYNASPDFARVQRRELGPNALFAEHQVHLDDAEDGRFAHHRFRVVRSLNTNQIDFRTQINKKLCRLLGL